MASYENSHGTLADGADFDVSMATGYTFSPHIMFDLRICTGRRTLRAQSTLPLAGTFSMGAAAAEFTYRFAARGRFRPMITLGYERSTILQGGNGLNGSGVDASAGIEYPVSREFALRTDAMYRYIRYDAMILNKESVGGIAPLTGHSFGISCGISLNFNLIP